MMITRIVRQCQRAAQWFSRRGDGETARIDVRLLMPEGDPLGAMIGHLAPVLYGPETDVLRRYVMHGSTYDYIVRITGDCPWTSSRVITKHLREALKQKADYTSNVLIRTFPEGQDVEVLSGQLLSWLELNAKTPTEREHVTLYVTEKPEFVKAAGFVLHTIFNDMDLSDIKTSVDTKAEYDDAAERFRGMAEKRKRAFALGTVGQ
jgi:spore coat polysaccharide biosynthesis protein SpsF (cytidylyltransferase family)